MTRTYYTLVSRTETDPRFAIEFGDYLRATVAEEMRDDERREFKIIRTSADDQASINAAVANLNGSK